MAVNPVQGLREPAPSTANPLGLAGLGLDANSDGIIDTSLLPTGSDPSVMFDVTSADDAEGLIDGVAALTVKGATGRLGVGTASPSDELTVGGASNVYAGVTMTGSGVAGGFVIEDATQEWRLIKGTGGSLSLRDVTAGSIDRILVNPGASGTGLLKSGTATTVMAWNASGVNVGVAATTPTSGRAFQVTTTAHGSGSVYVADADGTLHSPWDGDGTSPNISLGAADDLRLWHDGSNSYTYSYTGSMFAGTNNSASYFFITNNTTRGKWDSGGAFVVGSGTVQSGAKIDFQTTGQAHAMYVADADGTLHSPWDGSSGSPNIAVGASDDFKLYHDGTNNILLGASGQNTYLRSTAANCYVEALTSGSVVIRTGGGNTFTALDTGAVQISGISAAPTGSAGRLYYNSVANTLHLHDGTAWRTVTVT